MHQASKVDVSRSETAASLADRVKREYGLGYVDLSVPDL